MHRTMGAVILAFCALRIPLVHAGEPVKVDAGGNAGEFPHFWTGTGMAYVDLASKAWFEDTIMIAGIPHEETFIRCHNNFSFTDLVAFDGTNATLGFRRHDAWLDHITLFWFNDESLWTAYSEPVAKDAKRFYQVRAVDLWDRVGPWSEPIEAPEIAWK